MKKFKTMLNRSISTLIILLGSNLLIYLGTSASTNSNDVEFRYNALKYENELLMNKYYQYEKNLNLIENKMDSINILNNYFYSQIRCSNPNNNKIDTFKFGIQNTDSIFNSLDTKILYTSKTAIMQLNKLSDFTNQLKKNASIVSLYPDISPIRPNDFIRVSSGYGWRIHPIYKRKMFHNGIDVVAKPNSKVFTTISGVVKVVKYSNFGYGNRVIIDNSSGYETLYAHLNPKIVVREGQIVKKGQLIGIMGDSGNATGPHLHYEIHVHNQVKNPIEYVYGYLTNELTAKK